MTTSTNASTDDLLASALAELDGIEGLDITENTPVAATNIVADDDVDSLLADLELQTPVVTDTAAVTAVTDSELDELAKAVAVEDAKQEIYSQATAGGLEEVVDVSDAAAHAEVKSELYGEAEAGGIAEIEPAVPAPRAKSRAAGESKPSAALIARLGSVDAVHSRLVFTPEDATKSAEELKIECDKRLKSFDALPKKIGEKAVNLVMHLAGSASLSVYTQIALEILMTTGELSSKALVERYMARPYSEGTSRSQCGQIMKLFQAFGIADGTTSNLTLNKNSVIGQALKETVIGERAAA